MHFTYGVTILKSIIIVTLLIVYYQFFFKDVIENYSEGLTNIATTLKVFDESEIGIKAPALAVCIRVVLKIKSAQIGLPSLLVLPIGTIRHDKKIQSDSLYTGLAI